MFPLRTFHLPVYQWQVSVDGTLLELLKCDFLETNCTTADEATSKGTPLIHPNHWNEVTILLDDGEVSSCCICARVCVCVQYLEFPSSCFLDPLHLYRDGFSKKKCMVLCFFFAYLFIYHYLVGEA